MRPDCGTIVAEPDGGLSERPEVPDDGRAEASDEEPMTTIHRILCATDLSATSEPAWDEAKLLGRLFNAEILLLHVVAPPPVFPAEGYFPPQLYEELVGSARRDAQDRFDRLLGSVAGSGLKIRICLEEGPPAQRILEVVTQEAADLLVVGTHGRTGLERIVLGSVADRMVRQATCPVLTARSTPGSGPRREIRRISYATDFSPTARAAWPWVVGIAQATDAEVDLVHVTFEPVADHHLSAEAIGRMAQLLHDQGRIEAERFLERSPLPPERVHVRLPHGVPGEQIVRRAQEQAADLVVMGTHGWSGVVRWMLGSVAHHVIQTAPCPVLTIGPVSAQSEGARS
jgi:nucleotide-binding universal stress UspA family protein